MATQANITIDQGSDYVSDIDLTASDGSPQDLSTTFTVAGTIKKTYTSTTSVAFTATISNATGGQITLALTAAQTSGMKAGRYVYDVEIYDSNNSTTTRVLEGQVNVTPSVT